MHNDLIILSFERSEDREVLLSGTVLFNVTRSMSSAMTILATELRNGQPTKVDVLLYAAERGSLIVKLRPILNPIRSMMPSRETIGVAADLSTIIQFAAAGMVAAGIALGLLVANKQEPVQVPPELEALLDDKKIPPELRKAIEGWVSSSLEAGVEKVTISVPDAPPCDLSSTRWVDKKLFGSAARLGQALLKTAAVEGELELKGDPMLVKSVRNDESISLELFPGTLVSKASPSNRIEGPFPVLVEWQSKRVVPADQQKVRIKGRLSDIRNARNTFEPMEPVRSEAREARGFLVVTAQIIEE